MKSSPAATTINARLPLIALALGACAIGFAPIFVRLSPVEPTATGFWRLALALPFLFALRYFLHRLPLPSTPSKPHLARVPIAAADMQAAEVGGPNFLGAKQPDSVWRYALLLLPGFFFAGDLALWHWSIHFTTVANSTLLTNFAPIFVTLVAYFFLGERFDRRFPLGLLLAIAGAALLIRRSLEVSPDHLFGDLLGVCTALFYAAYQLSVKRLRRDFSTLALMFGSSLTGAVLLLALAIASGESIWPAPIVLPTDLNFSGGAAIAETLTKIVRGFFQSWGPLFGLALVSHIAGQGLIAYAFAHLSASFSSVSLLIQPIVATITAYYLFGEALGPIEVLGAGIVLAGVVLARLATRDADRGA
ncbi:MAG: DMT family transporter [Leptospirales bacterium]|jgi:drug/metabolite transporter (DMT)-like permease